MSGSAVKITSICSVCDRETKNTFKDYYIYTNGLINPFFCNKCKIVKSEKTCIDKYGFKNPMQCDSVKNILKESIREKYGVEHYSNTDEYKIMTVQFHPEASPGPEETAYIFDEFLSLIRK